jgi:hypothetical protein
MNQSLKNKKSPERGLLYRQFTTIAVVYQKFLDLASFSTYTRHSVPYIVTLYEEKTF